VGLATVVIAYCVAVVGGFLAALRKHPPEMSYYAGIGRAAALFATCRVSLLAVGKDCDRSVRLSVKRTCSSSPFTETPIHFRTLPNEFERSR
jgi:hypothetical protein